MAPGCDNVQTVSEMGPRLALVLLLFAGRVGAQLSCASEEELVANLRWVGRGPMLWSIAGTPL